jgi:hypothetical protein
MANGQPFAPVDRSNSPRHGGDIVTEPGMMQASPRLRALPRATAGRLGSFKSIRAQVSRPSVALQLSWR